MNTLCKGCGETVTWAKHERTGKRAPLVYPPENMPPNIFLYSDPQGDPTYRIGGDGCYLINHFANCKAAGAFRPSPKGDTQ